MPEQTPKQMLEQTGKQNTQQNASRSSPSPRTTTTDLRSELAGSSSTGEQSQLRQPETEDDRWLVGIQRDLISRTVLLRGFNPAITETLRGRKWATLERDRGWTIPARYLEHVERLLDGAGVDLFDVDGQPTPAQRRRAVHDARAETTAVLDELHAARDAAEADPNATEQARREARQAFDQALAARPPAPVPVPAVGSAAPVENGVRA